MLECQKRAHKNYYKKLVDTPEKRKAYNERHRLYNIKWREANREHYNNLARKYRRPFIIANIEDRIIKFNYKLKHLEVCNDYKRPSWRARRVERIKNSILRLEKLLDKYK